MADLLAVIELNLGHTATPEDVAAFCLTSASLLCGQLSAGAGGMVVAHEDVIAHLQGRLRQRNEVIDLLHKASHRLAELWAELLGTSTALSQQLDEFHGDLRSALQVAQSHTQSADRLRSRALGGAGADR